MRLGFIALEYSAKVRTPFAELGIRERGETIIAIARLTASAPRAVGGARGRNPPPLIIPCLRVVAAGKLLGGFMRGRHDHALSIKRWLLVHEGFL